MDAQDLKTLFPDVGGEILEHSWQPIKWRDGETITVGLFYSRMREQGNGDRFAAMCALQQSPRIMTDDVFWGGRKHFSEVYGEKYANEVKHMLAARGVSMTAHDEYCPELAEFKGDPRAVINRADGRSYIKKRCEEIGVGCEGAVTTKSSAPIKDPLAPENCIPMADDLVAENAARLVKEDSKAAKLSKAELKEAVIDKHGVKH